MQDAVRLYLRELRDRQGITQQDAADTVGLSLRAFSDWETGKSADIKFRFLARLVRLTNASWEDITHLELDNTNTDDGLSLAVNRIEGAKLVSDTEIQSLVEQLQSDKDLMRAFLIFWSGWKAREIA